jgi:hypothetical protein
MRGMVSWLDPGRRCGVIKVEAGAPCYAPLIPEALEVGSAVEFERVSRPGLSWAYQLRPASPRPKPAPRNLVAPASAGRPSPRRGVTMGYGVLMSPGQGDEAEVVDDGGDFGGFEF